MTNTRQFRPLWTTLSIILGFCLLSFIFIKCSGTRPPSSVAQYQFIFNSEEYRIRSIYIAERNERYNELIGRTFLAVDFDQDRIIDRISIGTARLTEAQKIYDYGLEMLTKENRLKELTPANHKYTEEKADLYLEIKSFYPENSKPFNQVKIISKKQIVYPEFIVAIDNEADGVIDEILKGTISLEKIQKYYSDLIESGLSKNGLVKTDGSILVKK
jgi:hypothetical protein